MVKLDELEAEYERAQLDNLPDTWIGKWSEDEVRVDKRGRTSLYVQIDQEADPKPIRVTQKFTVPYQSDRLKEVLEGHDLTSTEEARGKVFEWVKEIIGISNPRWLPLKIVQS